MTDGRRDEVSLVKELDATYGQRRWLCNWLDADGNVHTGVLAHDPRVTPQKSSGNFFGT